MGIFGGLGGLLKGGAGLLGMGSNPLGWALAGGQLLGGIANQRGQNSANAEQQRRYNELHQMITGQMQNGPGQWEQQMQSYLGQMSPQAQFDPSSSLSTPGMQGSQDALMQMLNRDPAQQLGQAGTTLSDLAATGGASNTQSLLDSVRGVQNQDLNNQVSGLRGGATSLGQRFGSTMGKNEAILRSQTGTRNTANLADILNQSNEANQGRRLSAAGTLGGLLQSGQQQRLGAAGQLAQMGQFGANLGMQGAQLNSQNRSNFIQQQLQAMGMGQNAYAQRQGQNASLIGLLSGQPGQQPNNYGGLMDSGMMAAFMPMLLQQMGQMNKPKAAGA